MRTLSMPFRFISLFMLTALASPASAQTVTMPDQVIVGGPVPIVINGLRPRQKVTLVAERVMSGEGQPTAYRAEAQYVADRRGRIVLASNAPVAGDYTGVDASGLFWSMHPTRLFQRLLSHSMASPVNHKLWRICHGPRHGNNLCNRICDCGAPRKCGYIAATI